jgi:FHA domain/Domain of unknown function (DUF1707)
MRATHRTRERTLARLREGYAGGELHTETFALRVEAALEAGSREALHGLTADLPAAGGRVHRAGRALRAALAPPAASGAPLLEAGSLRGGRLVLGRHPACELVFDDATVSRRHAGLRLRDGRWYLADLGSSNGTWVNGRRVFDAEVRPGDEIRLGDVTFRL